MDVISLPHHVGPPQSPRASVAFPSGWAAPDFQAGGPKGLQGRSVDDDGGLASHEIFGAKVWTSPRHVQNLGRKDAEQGKRWVFPFLHVLLEGLFFPCRLEECNPRRRVQSDLGGRRNWARPPWLQDLLIPLQASTGRERAHGARPVLSWDQHPLTV
ncbi:hypothetical protein CPLU01_09271 [Colletotrichum plurivorum]|uniref:Uncharacterized protein n=1 Tax=Colletotrichum plurivorum TaxID=2175906 RepID=A0A8H6NC32_9PEZI|nr:hypothetical protein CPLU01_09271 [Colletotrichum plurivorum]